MAEEFKIEDLELNKSNQVSTGAEETSEDATLEAEETGVNYYTPEEFMSLLRKSPLHMDIDRISPEQMPYYEAVVEPIKSMQADYTRKTQEIAEREKKITAQQPRDIYEAYMQDPDGVMNYINKEIANKRAEGLDIEVENLRDFKINLIERRQREIENMSRLDRLSLEVEDTVRAKIPDYDSKRETLTEFATKELGLTLDEVRVLSNPATMGRMAGKLTLAINSLYDRLYAGKSAERKVKKETPSPLARAGSGGEEKPTARLVEAALQKAKAEGTTEAWAEYLETKSKAKKGG